ncbi:MAG: hypothetical protein QXL09_00230 [Candidatus Aenigmatarchaeota archaeon]
MNIKKFATIIFIFVSVIIFGVLSSFLYLYIQATFIESELIKKFSAQQKTRIEFWFENFLKSHEEEILKEIEKSFGVVEVPRKENTITTLTSILDKVYMEIRKDNFFEDRVCSLSEIDKENCKITAPQIAHSNLMKYSQHLSYLSIIYGITTSMKDLERIDENFDKILLIPQFTGLQSLLVVWSDNWLSSYFENCTSNMSQINISEKKERYHKCSIKALDEIEAKSSSLIKEINFTKLDIQYCAQYLPLIGAQNIERYLSENLPNIKNPYLKLYYSVIMKSVDECNKKVFEDLKNLNLPCYEPRSISLSIKSIKFVITTHAMLALCMKENIMGEIGEEKY